MIRRRGRVLRAVAALALAALLAVGWAAWAGEYLNQDPRAEIPAGRPWRTPQGSTVSVQRWSTHSNLPSPFGPAQDATAGTTFVLVTLEFSDTNDQTIYQPRLYGARTQSWPATPLSFKTDNPSYLRSGGHGLVDVVYQVPTTKVPELRGVSFDSVRDGRPTLLLLPR